MRLLRHYSDFQEVIFAWTLGRGMIMPAAICGVIGGGAPVECGHSESAAGRWKSEDMWNYCA